MTAPDDDSAGADAPVAPWARPMSDETFAFLRDLLAAPSPVGYEGAMTFGVLEPYFERIQLPEWRTRRFAGHASLVLDTAPDDPDRLTILVVGHADKIRMQVRSIGDDGKIWIDSDSFLPMTLLGHEVLLFSREPEDPTRTRVLRGGTIEALGAIHFADAKTRSGEAGVKREQLYLELQLTGEDRKKRVEELGIRPGDPILLNRPIRRGFGDDAFYGAYLDNGLGVFCAAEVGRLLAEAGGTRNVRVLLAAASHEEIGRMGSRVIAGEMSPDVVIAVDVNHDYAAAPGIGDRRMTPLRMGEGFTLTTGAIVSEQLNGIIESCARRLGIPYQISVSGRDTGTDGMAAFLAGRDAATTSIGFPIRNMHTISESGHTGDVQAAVHAIAAAIQHMDGAAMTRGDFEAGHVRLDRAEPLG
ncbi:MAG: M20/M25/M40 family metallo-hydrolase [Planctomycetota bacterium]